MKKFLYMAVAAIAVLSSCDKNDAILDDNGNGVDNADAPVFTATIEGEGETKTQLVEGSTAGKLTKVEWLSTDKVFIAAANGSTAALMGTYSVTPKSDATTATLNPVEPLTSFKPEVTPDEYVAIYPASFSTLKSQTAEGIGENDPDEYYGWYSYSIILPQTQKYNGTDISQIAPMAAISDNTNLTFQNLTALLAITVKAEDFSSVSSITVSTKEEAGLALAGDFMISKNEGNLYAAEAGLGTFYYSVTLDCQNEGANTTIASGQSKTFYISIPAKGYPYLQIEVTDGTNTKTMKTKAASITVERNKIYPIAFADNTADPNLLKGVFTVSAGDDGVAGTADDKKVKFTKANLYWDGSAYQFETDQTNYPEAWNTSHVGLFFWSNYTDYTRTGEHAHEYKPYYSSFGASSKSTSDVFWCGEDHPLEVAGTQGLYVLSSDEWNYLLNIPINYNEVGRTQTNRFAKARVNGKAGLLIFPDGYNTELNGITGMCTVNEDWDDAYPGESESIDPATWTDMESAGVVFLPAAGYRGNPDGQTITDGYCQYWSSTPYDKNSAKDYEYAYGLYGTDAGAFTCPGKIERKHGSSIRLVKTVE